MLTETENVNNFWLLMCLLIACGVVCESAGDSHIRARYKPMGVDLFDHEFISAPGKLINFDVFRSRFFFQFDLLSCKYIIA